MAGHHQRVALGEVLFGVQPHQHTCPRVGDLLRCRASEGIHNAEVPAGHLQPHVVGIREDASFLVHEAY